MSKTFTNALKTVSAQDLAETIADTMSAMPSISSTDLKDILNEVQLDDDFMQEAFGKEVQLTRKQV